MDIFVIFSFKNRTATNPISPRGSGAARDPVIQNGVAKRI